MRPIPLIPLGFLVAGLCAPQASMAAHKETVMVPMRDGVMLATDTYVPEEGRLPTVLIRTPYGKGNLDQVFIDVIVDQLGFSLVMQDTRGQGASQGIDQVFYTDGWGALQDGYDTVDWIVQQAWCDGNVGEMGVSAMGIAALLNGGAAHPALKALHVGIAPTDFYQQAAYPGGSYREALIDDWVNGQDAGYMLEEYQAHPWDDAFWAQLDIRDRLASTVTIPIYFYGGFHDVFAEGTVTGYETMAPKYEAGEAGYTHLLMGPWTHLDEGAFWTRQGELTYPQDSLLPIGDASPFNWFNQWLKGQHRPLRDARHFPVRVFVMGDPEDPKTAGNYWAWGEEWPVPATTRRYYLRAGGGLSTTEGGGGEEPLPFIADPSDPSPTLGGRELSLPAGPRDQRPLQARDDVLFFETEPLEEAVTIAGPVSALVFFDSDAPDTDISVRLADGYPDGRSMLVADGVRRARTRNGYTEEDESFLTPGRVSRVEVEVGTTAQVFDEGHRIQVYIAGSNHRRFKVAGNTDLPYWEEGEGQVALNHLYVDESFASQLSLPIPRRGALKKVPDVPGIGRGEEAEALSRFAAGEALSEGDRQALQQAADRYLLELSLGAVRDALAPETAPGAEGDGR